MSSTGPHEPVAVHLRNGSSFLRKPALGAHTVRDHADLPLLLGALIAAALALPTTASAAATPSCFAGLGGTYDDYTIVGTGRAEVLVGTPGPDVVYAAGGDDDEIYGLGGDDVLCGAGGGDLIVGGDGNDLMDGADDPASYRSQAGKRTDDRADRFYGGPGNDNATGLDGDDWVEGGDGNDDIGGGRDVVLGGAGNDAVLGSGVLFENEPDLVHGGPGDDRLDGGPGFGRADGEDGIDAGVAVESVLGCETFAL